MCSIDLALAFIANKALLRSDNPESVWEVISSTVQTSILRVSSLYGLF